MIDSGIDSEIDSEIDYEIDSELNSALKIVVMHQAVELLQRDSLLHDGNTRFK